MTASFELEGLQFIVLNGGPVYQFSPAISFVVDCPTQEEVDELSEKLSEGGEIVECGWLKDKFGVSWQIIPSGLGDLLQHDDPDKARKAMEAMLTIDKIDINVMREACR
jgi:predicted 3-demethylubiquinone-9 3-methyltransferase (glyoxalase superfamily)